MEKKTLEERIKKGLTAVWNSVKAHPVEIIILLCVCVIGCYKISNPDILDINNGGMPWWFRPVVLAPFMVVAAYSLQPLRKRGIGWLLLYLLPLALMVAACAMPFLIDWTKEKSYWIAVFAAIPLWLCVRHWLTDNEPFVQRNVQMAWSLARALFVAGILYLLYGTIASTITFLFDTHYLEDWYIQVALLLFCGLAPVLFFAMEDHPELIEIRRFWAVLLNWVLTPALLIYALLLYVYAAKILFTWNLPKGGVAIMVTVFFVVFFAAKILQMLTEPQPFKWFYDHFSLFVLPLLALFWVGSIRRLMDYGLTEWRYYLLLGGGLITVCVLLFLFRNRRGYFVLAAGALCVVLLTVLVPPLHGDKVAMRSQIHRVRTLAKKLDRMNEDGTLRLPNPNPADTLRMAEHRRLYQSLDYISDYDTVLLKQEFGLSNPKAYLKTLSELTGNYVSAYSEKDAKKILAEERRKWAHLVYQNQTPIDLRGYSRVYADDVSWFEPLSTGNKKAVERWLEIGDHIKISMDELLDSQLQRYCLADSVPSEDWLEEHADGLLVYRTEDLMVVFEHMYLVKEEGEPWRVSSATVSFVLEK